VKHFLIKFLSITLLLVTSLNILADAYADDAAEVDYYVPGILANDSMEQVNFLLCFMEKTNFSDFVDQGAYIALVDEAKCESASGADSSSETASATGGSAASGSGGGSGTANTVEQVDYTPGVYQNITSGSTATGKGWIDLLIDVYDGSTETAVPTKGYVSTLITADRSATNRFGSFTMRYDLRNKEAVSGVFPVANLSMMQGYLKVDGSTVEYRENSLMAVPRIIKADLTDANNQQGFIQSNMRVNGASGSRLFAVQHKINVNEGANRYCQKFDGAVEYTMGASGPVASGTQTSESDLSTLITSTINAGGYVNTDGGSSTTITEEHCWDTRKTEAKRIIYQYGTYKSTDGSRASLTTPAMSLEANATDNGVSFTAPVYSHASYWGTHLDKNFRSKVSDSTIFRNQRDATDIKSYSLRKNYYEINRHSRQYLSLNQLGGVSFQMHVQGFKNDSTFDAKINALGFPITGNCTPAQSGNPAQDNCPEYSGVISVSGTTVTFTATHGMDWNNRVMPFKLNANITFTNTDWATQMVDGSFQRRMHFWDPDSHQSYTVPYAAFSNVASSSNASQARTKIREKIDIETLSTELGSDPLICIRECLGYDEMNAALGLAFTAVANNTNPGPLNTSAYLNIGPYFAEDGYYDSNLINGQEAGEEDIPKGRYNGIGGVLSSEAPKYSISSGKLREGTSGTTFLEYTTANAELVDARNHGDDLNSYSYYVKPDNTYADNWTHRFGWSFQMRAFKGSTQNINDMKCDPDGSNVRGYNQRYTKKSNSNRFHSEGQNYICDYKMWEGAIDTTYEINVRQMPDYRLYSNTDSAFVNVSPPQTLLFTVPAASEITYNFPNTDLTGQKFKLEFEGYGELHRIPGRVVNTCTGEVLGRYVDNWNDCYRYVHEFIIPDATVLTNLSGGDDIKVRALRGDEYLKKLASPPAGITYSDTLTLPAESTLQNLYEGTNAIGSVPSTSVPVPQVIHGETIGI
tara:strand:- start:202 stop:3135 length:2934 start_codon:yes stop_codon:yes gene_type:complete